MYTTYHNQASYLNQKTPLFKTNNMSIYNKNWYLIVFKQ